MTDDIVNRLRIWASVTEGDHVIEELHQAADEIERLGELLFQEIYRGQEKLDEIERLRKELDNATAEIQRLSQIARY
jgi:chromosome segregation ATPase